MENLGSSKSGRSNLATMKMKPTETTTTEEAIKKKKRIDKLSWGGAAADVLLLIFSRLPADSLARASAVCTAWYGSDNSTRGWGLCLCDLVIL